MLFEVCRTIESHVLHKVRKTALVVILQHRTRLDHQTQLQALLGAGVFLNVIGQTIGAAGPFAPAAPRALRIGQI